MNKMKTFEDCLEASLEIMYKDDKRIHELESALRDLCKEFRFQPYGWRNIEKVEKYEKLLNRK